MTAKFIEKTKQYNGSYQVIIIVLERNACTLSDSRKNRATFIREAVGPVPINQNAGEEATAGIEMQNVLICLEML